PAVEVVATPMLASPSPPRILAPTAVELAVVVPPVVSPPPVASAEPAAAPVTRLARTLRAQTRLRAGTAELLLFRVATEWFAIALSVVEEAVDLPEVHFIPEMPPAMLGVVTVRGTLTPVYSPATTLGLTLDDGGSALIFRRGSTRLALVIDDVDDVISVDLSALRDTPLLDANDGLTLGVLRRGDKLVAILDADALLAACQLLPSLEIA
ncbi:MAG: chemotaxis protein CheW, partial [Geodermatophilaceae bacterium]|nr:chemotaxis protein CheW [Geodermatophilaceae bacterium]